MIVALAVVAFILLFGWLAFGWAIILSLISVLPFGVWVIVSAKLGAQPPDWSTPWRRMYLGPALGERGVAHPELAGSTETGHSRRFGSPHRVAAFVVR